MAVKPIQVYRYFSDPQLSNRWEVLMPDVLGLGSQTISFFAETCDLPTSKAVSPDEYQHKGQSYHIAGMLSSENASITFYIDQTNYIERYFTAWQKLIANDDGTRNYKSEYEKDIIVTRLNNVNLPVTRYALKGCFPLGGITFNFTATKGDRLTYQQQFSVDSITVTYLADFNNNGI